MLAPDTRTRARIATAATIAAAMLAAGASAVVAAHGPGRETLAVAVAQGSGVASGQEAASAIALPTRHGARPPAPGEPSALPAGADTLAPVTLIVVTQWEQPGRPPRTSRQTILRTRDRVLVITEDQRREWLFERNPIDGRRVSASLIDHATRRILVHQESDLRTGQHVRGWGDVVTLRVDPAHLPSLRATGEQQTMGGETFVRYVSEAPVDVWWSARRLLPLRVTTREGSMTMTSAIESLRDGVDESRLAPPASRFPAYRVMDVADAREAGRH